MMKKTRRTLSLLLVLGMIVSLLAGMTVTAWAEAGSGPAETLTIEIIDKNGLTRTLATWTYDETQTTYRDNADNAELSLVKDFTQTENLTGTVNGAEYDFTDLHMLVYSGANSKPDDCRAWAVTAKGILLEDLFLYAGDLLDPENGTSLLKSDDVTLTLYSGKRASNTYSYSTYWGLTKYYYPTWMEKEQPEGTVSLEDQTGCRVVPSTLALLGHHGTGDLPEFSTLTPDSRNALRSMQGQMEGGAETNVDANLGYNSLKNIDKISFHLSKTFEEVGLDGGHETGEYDIRVGDLANGSVTVSKRRAAKDDIVTVEVTPDTGYRLQEHSLQYNGNEITKNTDGNYSFTMPAEAVTVTAVFEEVSAPEPETVEVSFAVTPDTATVSVMQGENLVEPGENGAYTLTVGETYRYTVSADGYVSASGEITAAKDTETPITVTLTKTGSSGGETGGGTGGTGDIYAPVWDGRSIDITWYDPEETEYHIYTPAQLAGLAAIVNGLYNKAIDTVAGNEGYIKVQKGESSDTDGGNQSTSTYHYGNDNFSGKTVYLEADIDMGDSNYMPIGGQYLMTPDDPATRIDASFCGVFDGQGHSVTISCDRYAEDKYGDGASVGLIGRLGVHDNDDPSLRPTGAAVRDVAVYGSVKANRHVGGVVGKTGKGDETLIERCANFASVTGTDAKGTGGIVGAAWNAPTIRDCYNTGTVRTTYPSGMTGGIAGSSEATIINCYNVGTITGPAGNTTAAIATPNNGGDTYENCYWLSGSADEGVYDKTLDSVVEKTAAELKSAEMLELLGSAFAADTDGVNRGYPVLYWQSSGAPEPDPDQEQPGETELPFTDVDGHWALDAIRYAYENELFQGVSETEFAPDTTMTRAMLVTVLYRLAGEPEVAGNADFTDVDAGQWYAKAVAWAAEKEIIKGYGSAFGPNDLVTREQMAAILLRYAAWRQYETTAGKSLSDYADYAEISGWATAALEWANAEGLILGRTETTIVPQGDATRAEVATILMRFIEKLAEK